MEFLITGNNFRIEQKYNYTEQSKQDKFVHHLLQSSIKNLLVFFPLDYFPIHKVLYSGNISRCLTRFDLYVKLSNMQLALLSRALIRKQVPLNCLQLSPQVVQTKSPGAIYYNLVNVERLVFNHTLFNSEMLCLLKSDQTLQLNKIECYPDHRNSLTSLLWKLVLYSALKYNSKAECFWFYVDSMKKLFEPSAIEFFKTVLQEWFETKGANVWV